jgi:hypothetical protein
MLFVKIYREGHAFVCCKMKSLGMLCCGQAAQKVVTVFTYHGYLADRLAELASILRNNGEGGGFMVGNLLSPRFLVHGWQDERSGNVLLRLKALFYGTLLYCIQKRGRGGGEF